MEEQALQYQFDTVEVLPAARVVTGDGRPIELEPKAFRVLLYLVEHRDRAVSKDELMDAVWQDAAVTDNALTRIVAQIRRELGTMPASPALSRPCPRWVTGLSKLPSPLRRRRIHRFLFDRVRAVLSYLRLPGCCYQCWRSPRGFPSGTASCA
jgi:hypothetical protein